MTDLVLRDDHRQGGSLEVRPDQSEWTPAQHAALAHMGIADAPVADQQVFLHYCQRTKLDPFSRQIYMIGRKDRGDTKYTIQTGIDGFRVIANRNPNYDGPVGPEWCGPDGVWRDVWVGRNPPIAARVGVLRKDQSQVTWGVALFCEYAQTKYDGELTKMWAEKGVLMIAKCAEALALRKAFPQDLAGLYTDDEMGHVNNAERQAPRVVEHPRRQQATSIAQVAGPGALTREQGQQLGALFTAAGVDDRAARLRIVCDVVGRDLASAAELTQDEAERVLVELADQGADGIAALARPVEDLDADPEPLEAEPVEGEAVS